MFPILTSVIGVLLFCTQSLAIVEFVSPPLPEWEAETLATMDWVNSQLPQSWPKPDNFKIALAEDGDPRYYPLFRYKGSDGILKKVHQLLVLGDRSKAKLIHEYAHLIMDTYLRENSGPWQYYLVWNEIDFNDIDESIDSYTKLIANLKKAYQEYLIQKQNGDDSEFLDKALFNTSNSISKYETLLEKLQKAKKIQDQSSVSLNQMNSFEALEGMNELFADTLAAVLLKNWSIMKESTLLDLANTDLADKLVLPDAKSKEEAIAMYVEHRDFQQNLTLENYPYQLWESHSPYTRYAPVRSLIRSLVEKKAYTKKKILSQTLKAIQFVYEKELVPFPENLNRSLLEKNKALASALHR